MLLLCDSVRREPTPPNDWAELNTPMNKPSLKRENLWPGWLSRAAFNESKWTFRFLACAVTTAFLSLAAGSTAADSSSGPPAFRPPAVPLVAHDPYFSIWSPADKLTDADTMHWTGKPQRLTSLVRIDGKGFRIMGKEPASVPALPQTNLEVLPTRTIYTFEGEGVRLTLTFMTPALPGDLEVLSRPVTYLTWETKAIDGKEHNVETYLDAAPEIAVNHKGQAVKTEKPDVGGLDVLAVGSAEQAVLREKGDDLRIDWGRFYIATRNLGEKKDKFDQRQYSMFWGGDAGRYLEAWAKFGGLASWNPPGTISTNDVWPFYPTFPRDEVPLRLVVIFRIDNVGSAPVSRWLMLAYDDEYSIKYFRSRLRPYWRRNGDDAAALLQKAAADYESLKQRCEQFDAELMADLRQGRRREVCPTLRARLPPDVGRKQNLRRRQRSTADVPEGKFLERLHRHRRCAVSAGAVLPGVQSRAHQGDAGARAGLRRVAALALPVCAA